MPTVGTIRAREACGRPSLCAAKSITLLSGVAVPFLLQTFTAVAADSTVDTLEEIVVTAQKRSENVQDVPSSISVLGGEQLQTLHAVQLTDYAAYVPGFQVDTRGSPGQAQLTLRGVAASISSGPTVGVYLDDSPVGSSSIFAQGSSFQVDLMPYDIERIEVLRGPQGTLYGASTMGGLLKYVTRAPDLDSFELRAGTDVLSIKGGSGTGAGGRAGINVPLIDGRLALRASVYKEYTPGYIDNALSGRKDENALQQLGGRAALLWRANDQLSVKLSAMIQNVDSESGATVVVNPVPRSAAGGIEIGRPIYGDLSSAHALPTPFSQRFHFYSATVNYDLGWAELVSATSYSLSHLRINIDFSQAAFGSLVCQLDPACPPGGHGLAPLHTELPLEKVTQELRLASPTGGRFEWLLGGFYTNEDAPMSERLGASSAPQVPLPFIDPLAFLEEPSKYREIAFFGDATYRFNSLFDTTAGLRWARNSQSTSTTSSGLIFDPPSITNAGSSEDVVTYMVSPRLHLTQDVMLYARVASGYRPGGPNAPFPGVPPKADSDRLTNYELGFKSELLEHRATVDLSVFDIEWKDIQVQGITPDGLNYNTNGGTARSRGVELATLYAPIAGLHLGLNTSYTDAHLTEPLPSLQGQTGDRLPLSAKVSASLTAEYAFPLQADWTGRAGGGYRYVGDRFSEVESSPTSARLPAYRMLDLNIGLSNGRFNLNLFAKNVLDERAYLSTITDRVRAVLPVNIAQPRTIGASLDVRF